MRHLRSHGASADSFYICPSCRHSLFSAARPQARPESYLKFVQDRKQASFRASSSAAKGRGEGKRDTDEPHAAGNNATLPKGTKRAPQGSGGGGQSTGAAIQEMRKKDPWGIMSTAKNSFAQTFTNFFRARQLQQDLKPDPSREDVNGRPAWGDPTSATASSTTKGTETDPEIGNSRQEQASQGSAEQTSKESEKSTVSESVISSQVVVDQSQSQARGRYTARNRSYRRRKRIRDLQKELMKEGKLGELGATLAAQQTVTENETGSEGENNDARDDARSLEQQRLLRIRKREGLSKKQNQTLIKKLRSDSPTFRKLQSTSRKPPPLRKFASRSDVDHGQSPRAKAFRSERRTIALAMYKSWAERKPAKAGRSTRIEAEATATEVEKPPAKKGVEPLENTSEETSEEISADASKVTAESTPKTTPRKIPQKTTEETPMMAPMKTPMKSIKKTPKEISRKNTKDIPKDTPTKNAKEEPEETPTKFREEKPKETPKKKDTAEDDEFSIDRERLQSLREAMAAKTIQEMTSVTVPSFEAPRKTAKKGHQTLRPKELNFAPLDMEQPPVPGLAHGLDRVLFNQGVYQLQDDASRVYNFDPYLQKIMPVAEFDFNALKVYKTSSQDEQLSDIARESQKKYVGSTSSMTGTLGHFHYLLSNWRPLNLDMLSKGFPEHATTFTEINRAPNAMFLRWKNGTYAIDADKQYEGANVLMLLGKSLEKLLTMPPSDFERYRKSDPREITDAERNDPESYHYSTQGDMLMRSQLDAYDSRLPGTGTFDLKTRAVLSVRMRSGEPEGMTGYELKSQLGRFQSYEREYYDMMRSTLLKYSLQARMGRMDGIFLAYHNIERMFGFQYLNMAEIDRALHGQEDTCLGDQEFTASIELLNQILNKATEKFPGQSIRFHFETRPSVVMPFMYICAEPMSEDAIDEIQNSQKDKVAEFERKMMGVDPERAAEVIGAQNEKVKLAASTNDPEEGIVNADETEKPSASKTRSSPSMKIDPANRTIEENLKPLLTMSLTIRSKVDGKFVDHPTNLSPDEDWAIEYQLAEIEPPSKAWALYEACKERRRQQFETLVIGGREVKDREEKKTRRRYKDDNGDNFIDMLRDMSIRGRAWRSEQDRLHGDGEKVVVGDAPPRDWNPSSSSDDGTNHEIDQRQGDEEDLEDDEPETIRESQPDRKEKNTHPRRVQREKMPRSRNMVKIYMGWLYGQDNLYANVVSRALRYDAARIRRADAGSAEKSVGDAKADEDDAHARVEDRGVPEYMDWLYEQGQKKD